MEKTQDLRQLLQNLQPELAQGEYVFASFGGAEYGDLASLSPLASISEQEGLTLVLDRPVAEAAGVPSDTVLRRISLGVHSSLEAVGLTAAISTALDEKGISANVIAGYYHDHVFVPSGQADEALAVLKSLSGSF